VTSFCTFLSFVSSVPSSAATGQATGCLEYQIFFESGSLDSMFWLKAVDHINLASVGNLSESSILICRNMICCH